MMIDTVVRHFKTDDGLQLAYADEGTGTPLLCLAGLTRNMRDFEPVRSAFAEKVRVIRLDSRGRGLSEFDSNYQNYNIPREAQDALALMDHLGLEKAAILGTSRGGLIAMTLAAGHKDRLAGVVLNDIGPVIEEEGLTYISSYLGRRPGYQSYDHAAENLQSKMGEMFPRVSLASWRIYAERLWIEGPEELELRYDPALRTAVEESSQAGPMPDLWPLYEMLQGIPVTILRGANSNILSRANADRMQARHDQATYVEVPDRGHVPFLDEPIAVTAIAEFLERVT
ncbi:alpha/beta fold hydrolase [Litoreibacter roseus]|uniref:Hydrolase n=1 Tax=Litoreibacter roseus TaxID=2601869 RepID=A0A6N6JCW4_9RHOB|nr:alpha/beta hydrolase [Litoreibacter roseus]GFE63042.1 hydrolase [Litoreibacter roseus]